VNEDVAPEDSAPAAEATAEVVEPAAEAATETALKRHLLMQRLTLQLQLLRSLRAK